MSIKYLHKGHDLIKFVINKLDKEDLILDQISDYLDSRYGPMESAQRIQKLSITHSSYDVVCLAVYTENQQFVTFRENDVEKVLNKNNNTSLTAWFELNKNDKTAHKYFYIDIPKFYRFDQTKNVG